MTHLRYGQPVAYHHTSVYLVANTRKTIVGAPWSIQHQESLIRVWCGKEGWQHAYSAIT